MLTEPTRLMQGRLKRSSRSGHGRIKFSADNENLPFNPFPKQALGFMCLQYKSFENTVGKGEMARNEQFLLFPQCFLPVWKTFCHFHQI